MRAAPALRAAPAFRATSWLGLFTLILGLVLGTPVARADTGDIGYEGASFAGSGEAPTADKPQSKLWFNDGLWWADLFDTASGTWHIFRLDRTQQTWVDTGTLIDERPLTRGDTLWDGTHLYIATNVLAASSTENVAGQPARLFRYSYDGGQKTFSLDTGFPVDVNNVSSESLTLAKDGNGTLWVTWTQGKKVYVNSSEGDDASWGTPFALNVTGASGLTGDDISAMSAYGGNKIGVMWSNQATSAFYFASHTAGDSRTTWTGRTALSDPGIADDHINLTQLEGDEAGRLYAAVKTSLETEGDSSAQNLLLGLNRSTGTWEKAVFGTFADCHTRPMIVIDNTNKVLHMFASAPSTDGCPHTGTPGTIYEKTSSLDKLAFPAGRGTPIIHDADSAGMNNVTGTKQSVTKESGLVLLASNDETQRYWHADISLSGGNNPGTSKITHGGSTTTGSASNVTAVTLAKPSGTTTGDVLIAGITTDVEPKATAPAGWKPLATLRPSGASMFGYYHVVTDDDAATSSWTWTLSTAAKWSGGMSRYAGVDPSSPLDSTVTTAMKTGSQTVSVPAVTTTTKGAVVVGAMGTDSGKVTATPPSGWTETWQNQTGQLSESAFVVTSAVGAQAATAWKQSGTVAMAAWTVALRPRSGS